VGVGGTGDFWKFRHHRHKLDWYTGSARILTESRSGQAVLKTEQREWLENDNRGGLEIA
jgi:hypothetical protein